VIVATEKSMAKPFLKWAGGKRQILRHLLEALPPDVHKRTYREPFLGAGSMFFALNPARAFLSDANGDLILCYEEVRDNPDLVSEYLLIHKRNDCEAYYYRVREEYNRIAEWSAAQSARFIYLNKTCYNGIFRVNSKGLFNVPYGRHEKISLPSREHLRQVSRTLRSKKIFTGFFEKTLEDAQKGDFIYLDPPYPPLNGTSCFNHYIPARFTETDQENLAETFKLLDRKGCLLMMTNGSSERIQELYDAFNVHELSVRRFITCKQMRNIVQELVITNYEV